MKNVQYLPMSSEKCWTCKSKGYFSITPEGGDYITCPCCGSRDFKNDDIHGENKYNWNIIGNEDNRIKFNYCNYCKIVFMRGCTHASNGCTVNDQVVNGHFVKRWKDIRTGDEFTGMPHFDNDDEWYRTIQYVDVMEWFCPDSGKQCPKSYHQIDSVCSLYNTI